MNKQEVIEQLAGFAADLRIAAGTMTQEEFRKDVLATADQMVRLVLEETKIPIFISGVPHG